MAEHFTALPWSELDEVYTPEKIANRLECFPPVNKMTQYTMMDGSNCLSKFIADILNSPDQKSAKTSAFMEVFTLAADQLINCIIL